MTFSEHQILFAGPKVKMISQAPWDTDRSDTQSSFASTSTSTDPPSSSSSASVRTRGSSDTGNRRVKEPPKELPKEHGKPKSSSRTRSVSVLSSRRSNTDSNDAKASEEALRGLGLVLPPTGEASPTKDHATRSLKSPVSRGETSFLDLGPSESRSRSPSGRKGSAPPDLGGNVFAFPQQASSPLPSPPPTLQKVPRSRGKSPAPAGFEMVTPGAPQVPCSAPPTTTFFSAADIALPTSSSTSTLTVRIPTLSTSGSLHSLASGLSSPSPYPSSPTSTTGLPSPNINGVTSSSGGVPAGYKLISLSEARQRESDRVANAAAQRKAMLPVEHIAGREEISYGAPTERKRESSISSLVGRNSVSGPSGGFNPPPSQPLSASSTAASIHARSLKTKKSGFLKRMMGGEKTSPLPAVPDWNEAPVPETFRALADDYVHPAPLSVTVSSPDHSSFLAAKHSTTTPTTTSRMAFLSTPTPDPDLRIRKGLAPSLSLRPISMAFSAGLPTDFLAGIESGTDHARTPRNTSPTVEAAHSPFAPSFRSATTHSSSIFDDSASLSSSSANTPVTHAFSPLIPYFHHLEKSPRSPAYEGPQSLAKLQDQFLKATKAWKVQQFDLESQIRALRNELEEVKGGVERRASSEADASECRVRSFLFFLCGLKKW